MQHAIACWSTWRKLWGDGRKKKYPGALSTITCIKWISGNHGIASSVNPVTFAMVNVTRFHAEWYCQIWVWWLIRSFCDSDDHCCSINFGFGILPVQHTLCFAAQCILPRCHGVWYTMRPAILSFGHLINTGCLDGNGQPSALVTFVVVVNGLHNLVRGLRRLYEPEEHCIEHLRESTSFLIVKRSGYSRLDENQNYLRTFGSRSIFCS